MLRIRRWSILLCAVPVFFLGCERPEERGPEIPAGVSVDPPRRAAETGSLTLPGQEPDQRLEAGDQGATLDTVSPPVQGPGQ